MVAIATIDSKQDLRCTIDAPKADADAELVRRALEDAAPKLARWVDAEAAAEPLRKELLAPIAIHLLPDHSSLERAVGQSDLPWLRAWSFARDIYLQSPRSWSEAAALSRDPRQGAMERAVSELLAHELTHALMYQLLEGARAAGGSPAADSLPLWFREGMASVTAGQDAKRMDPPQLARWLLASPGENPLAPTPEMLRDAKDAVYSAAHRAFELLDKSCGDAAAISILFAVRGGSSFDDAFAAVTGQTVDQFLLAFVAAIFDPSRPAGLCPAHPREG